MLDTPRHQGLRRKMIAGLQTEGITDQRVLQAMSKVPRHAFLDKAFAELAYENRAFTIGEGQTISHPYTVAYQSALLKTEPGMKVLEIGTGSGYQAAVLAELGVHLYTLERIRPLFEKTKPLLRQLGYTKIKCFHKDGFEGLPALAPFDRIIVTAAAPEMPKSLLEQLSIGGIMILPFGEGAKQKMLRMIRAGKTDFQQETLDEFSFVPMLKGEVG
jgi:protein-L-isoaspartate(D-aspartate) O-methyltransferase